MELKYTRMYVKSCFVVFNKYVYKLKNSNIKLDKIIQTFFYITS